MSIQQTFERYAIVQGWNAKSQEMILDGFIVASKQEITFADFLDGKALQEGANIEPAFSLDDFKIPMGWNEETTVKLLLEYLENQNAREFETYLGERASQEND